MGLTVTESARIFLLATPGTYSTSSNVVSRFFSSGSEEVLGADNCDYGIWIKYYHFK